MKRRHQTDEGLAEHVVLDTQFAREQDRGYGRVGFDQSELGVDQRHNSVFRRRARGLGRTPGRLQPIGDIRGHSLPQDRFGREVPEDPRLRQPDSFRDRIGGQPVGAQLVGKPQRRP